jgi:threo-3-hydroxy-L-aspartate ammonia-lyase
MNHPPAVEIKDVREASATLEGVAHRTPVLASREINQIVGADVVFKCENFQRIGAFKFRGAFNAMSRLTDDRRRAGVIAYSSGNHAQAVALSAKILGINATIVMPADAPACKLDATRGYLAEGGPDSSSEVVLYDRTVTTREVLAREIIAERSLTLIPPYDHPDVIAGQGTAALELFEHAGSLDALFVPCGGGGLLSGCATVAKALCPTCKVVGVEPRAGDDATRSFKSGSLQTVENPDTIADGARTPSLGEHTFPIVLARVDEMMTVTDAELVAAMRLVWERMKLVIEPTAALGLAGVVKARQADSLAAGAKVGVILSGGNVNVEALGDVWKT